MCILGVSLILLHIFWVKYPQNPNFFLGGGWREFWSQKGKILKVSCYRNYCTYFNQIWHNDRDHEVVIVGGPSRRPTNLRWRAAAILKKSGKSPYVCDRSTDFDEIWHDDVADQPFKFWIFENPRWRRPPSWKITKSRYLRSGLTDLYKIWYAEAKWAS